MTRRHKVFFVFLGIWAVAAYFTRGNSVPKAKNPPQPTFPPPVSKFTTRLPLMGDIPPPEISAQYVFIMDRGSKMVLYSRAADDRIYPASTTKMMTALVASEHFDWDTHLTVSRSYPDGVDIGLRPGEQVSVENLLYALLIQSANDAAEVLAENYPGGRTGFISSMNQWADRLNLRQTNFLNPTGLDQDGHLSSASDLARLAASGVDGVWLQAVLTRLAPFPWDARQSEGHKTRLKSLRLLVERARRHGVGVYLYLNEPRSCPTSFFATHEPPAQRPSLLGVVRRNHELECPRISRVPSDRQGITKRL